VNGHVWLRGSDEPRYHRALVGPASTGPVRLGPVRLGPVRMGPVRTGPMPAGPVAATGPTSGTAAGAGPGPAGSGPRDRVLILGGGDGLAAHEVLRLPGVSHVDMITPDPDLLHLARTTPTLSALNGHAFRDPRLHVTVADPVARLRDPPGRYARGYDLVVDDLPEPAGTAHAATASQEFYGLVGRVLSPDGRFVVRTGRPGDDAGRLLWTVDATLRAAGLHTVPYCTARWGFVLAAHDRGALTGAVPRAGPGGTPAQVGRLCSGTAVGPRDLSGLRPAGTAPSTLVHPRYGG
jgi:spermidine synthase